MAPTSLFETWRASISLPTHEVSSWGRIRLIPYSPAAGKLKARRYGGKITVGTWDKTQKRYVYQFRGKTYRIAYLVCEAFHGPKPFPQAVAMHLDEGSRNNCAVNLDWGTQKENLNARKFLAYCKTRKGADNPNVKGRIRRARAARL